MMKQTLLLERVMDQTRMAVIEDGELCELHIERPGTENLTGNIYLGRVENVLPGMNAAFVDIGADKNGFLAAEDAVTALNASEGRRGPVRIGDLVRPGQAIPVQVVKAQPGAKGPRLTGRITLPGRLMALTPMESGVGVSKKIADADEREWLSAAGRALAGADGFGMILRTAADGADAAAIREEYARLSEHWRDIAGRAAHGVAPRLLYDDNSLSLRAVRDRLGAQTEALWVDDAGLCQQVRALADRLAPEYTGRVRRHEGDIPLFDVYRVDAQADKALQKYVWLKSGGSLVIEETEALTVVDVNTGKNVGRRDAGETILANNLEAARELMRQLRLRDIGGIVVADFIDMAGEAQKQALLDALRACAARDANRTKVVGITALGLVELTRKKARQSLGRQLLHTCPHCGGDGAVFAHETTARRAIRELWRRRRGGDATPMLIMAAPEVCGWMKTIGAPEGGATWALPTEGLEAGEYRLSPVDPAALPAGCKLLKRG